VLAEIVSAVRRVIEDAKPEITADIHYSGVTLTGGGALLSGMAERLRDDLNLRVTVPEDPLTTVASGAGRLLEDTDKLQTRVPALMLRSGKMRRSWRLIGSKVRSTDFRKFRSSQFLPFCGILASERRNVYTCIYRPENLKDYNVSSLAQSFLPSVYPESKHRLKSVPLCGHERPHEVESHGPFV